MSARKPSRSASGPPWWLIILIAAVLGVLAFYLWDHDRALGPAPYGDSASAPRDTTGSEPGARINGPEPGAGGKGSGSGVTGSGSVATLDGPATGAEGGASSPGSRAAPSGTADAARTNAPRYPLPARAEGKDAAPLPKLAASDPSILADLLGLTDREHLARYGNLQDLTRRFVVTVDHLPRELIPAQYSALQRMPGALAVSTRGETFTLEPRNFSRYNAFVAFAESLGPKAMVAIYVHFYPLLQQEYRAMGFPNGYFNDRVIEAIDDMLAAPQVTGPIELVQPKVHYKFADPALESLSAGRKIMIRIGPENAARLKKVLQGIRAELVR